MSCTTSGYWTVTLAWNMRRMVRAMPLRIPMPGTRVLKSIASALHCVDDDEGQGGREGVDEEQGRPLHALDAGHVPAGRGPGGEDFEEQEAAGQRLPEGQAAPEGPEGQG